MSDNPQQVPSVGQIVHIVTFDGHHRPAIVVDAGDDSTIIVTAFVDPRDETRPQHQSGAVLWFLDDCPHDPAAQQPGSWHWPEYVPAKS